MSLNGNTFLLCALCLATAMASPDVTVFFPQISGNLTQITWAHAVNNQSYLTSTLNDSSIMMIEADIVLGTINGTNSTEQIPVMGHPPANTSDISLATFLDTINTFNTNLTNSTNSTATRKGVKLDFKTIEVFNQSISIVKQYDQGDYPLWLNADILSGPINATTEPVDAAQFLASASQFNYTVLSIGWTTEYGANMTGSYNDSQVTSMLNAISQNNVTHNITFPVRAGLAAESLSQMQNLVANVTNSTLTLWSSEGDSVNVTNLRTLIGQIGIRKIFVDVPEDLRSQLRLDTLPSGSEATVPAVMVPMLVGLVAFMFR
ncbi:hypothetical protein NQ318_006412 [Aromia moschata]|uniref:Menorin-like domain-containing protein n=1 Tax=Aromia moschata TaxID=1265417 RepID=A0AAV8YKF9_9CUCU|nr:hypothetical protein NQ318_006412 [Aromia moschata]